MGPLSKSLLAFMADAWERKRKLQLMVRKTVENSFPRLALFAQISDERLEAYNDASIPWVPEDADFGESLGLGRILMHFYTNRKLGNGRHRQLKAYCEVLAPRSGGLSRALRPPLDRSGPNKHKPDR